MAGSKVTIDSIVRSFLIEKGEDIKINYLRYLHLAIKGMEDLHFDISGTPVKIDVTVSNNSTIEIPDDSVNILGVYFKQGEELIAFARNRRLATSNSDSCGVAQYETSDGLPSSGLSVFNVESYTNHIRNGENIGGYYNSPVANPFSFIENESNGTIELSSNSPTNVVLEYLPRATQVNSEFIVSPFVEEPLIAWLKWVSVRSKSTTSPNLSNQLQRIYVLAKSQLEKRLSPLTRADFSEAANRGRTASPRF